MMSDDFIPFNQSTPKVQGGGGWKPRHRNHNFSQSSGWRQNSPNYSHRQNSPNFSPRWSNSPQSHRNSFGSDRSWNNSQQSFNDINAYLHPSMLQDPWESLRRSKAQQNESNKT